MTLADQISLMNSMIKINRDVEIWEFVKEVKLFDIRAEMKRALEEVKKHYVIIQDKSKWAI